MVDFEDPNYIRCRPLDSAYPMFGTKIPCAIFEHFMRTAQNSEVDFNGDKALANCMLTTFERRSARIDTCLPV